MNGCSETDASLTLWSQSDGASRQIDLTKYPSRFSLGQRIKRTVWDLVHFCLFRPSPRIFFGWRSFLLRCFGAQIGPRCAIYPACKVWAPWNLQIGEQTALADDVDCYCVDKVRIGSHVTISQYTFLCTASHDVSDPHMRLITAPIMIQNGAWVCADVFVGPGVTIGQGAVAAARAVVLKDIPAWTIAGGNPAKFIKQRELKESR